MFDKHIIGEDSARNVEEDGEVIGFAFDTRIAYYRGLGLSMVEPFEVRVDGGDPVPADRLRFTIDDRTWTFGEMEHDYESRWEMTDTAVVTVLQPGGLPAGRHELDVTEVLRISYLPMLSRTRFVREVEVAR